MNIGTLKANGDGVHIGRIVTMAFAATIALREFVSTNERAPAFDVMALSADRRSWVKVGALWEYTSNETGEVFLSGRIDDPSLDKPIDVALFRQNDDSYNVAWRRPQRKRTLPGMVSESDGELPALHVGQRVEHPVFGEGIILNAEGEGARARVQVSFDGNGVKWLVLGFAKLTPL